MTTTRCLGEGGSPRVGPIIALVGLIVLAAVASPAPGHATPSAPTGSGDATPPAAAHEATPPPASIQLSPSPTYVGRPTAYLIDVPYVCYSCEWIVIVVSFGDGQNDTQWVLPQGGLAEGTHFWAATGDYAVTAVVQMGNQTARFGTTIGVDPSPIAPDLNGLSAGILLGGLGCFGIGMLFLPARREP